MTTNAPATGLSSGTNGLRDIRPPVAIPDAWMLVWLIAGILLAVGLAFLIWWLWQRKRKEILMEPIIPPHVRARQKLEEALGYITQPKPFCILVSRTIRVYLEERFDFHAPERTTEEFLYELRKTDLLSPDQKESLGEFLKRCDLVKFARYEPREAELRELHASAMRLVAETEPLPEPATLNGATDSESPLTLPAIR